MELNREQIVKAMEDCINRPKCIDYPNLTLCSGHDFEYLLVQALDLIKELTEENERLSEELAKSYNALDEQMNFYCSFTKSKIQNCPIDDEVAKAKADTVRKMQERLKESLDDFYTTGEDALLDVPDLIDQIVKEMLEGEKSR